eukprot:snap_masked-scaffold1811_size27320-processed-gene-0.0 protein:Tk00377 transcript:snap_masked-scaffold1811_size27320-processed-gene-0.0-mRNA-1 annotation:"hypothetical protein D910_10638"
MAPNFLRRQVTVSGPPPPPEAIEAFKEFVEAEHFPEACKAFKALLLHLSLAPGPFHEFYPKLKAALKDHVPFKYKEIFKILDAKAKQKPYQACGAENQRVLVVGAGPCGLRAAIEIQLLGAKTICIEKREDFTRNNILKLWKFIIPDLKALAVKKFVGQFCSGQINHIGIKTLQLYLSKIAMILGVAVFTPLSLDDLVEPHDDMGWTAKLSPAGSEVDNFEFDMVVIASGRKVALDGFNRRSLDAKMAIAVTANFKNTRTPEEARVNQISGISKQYHQQFFKDMMQECRIDLENIVYYRGDTHYFVMTALRSSLIEKGVILRDSDERQTLLAPNNINREKLHQFAIEAAQFSTGQFSAKLPVTEFALDARGRPDCAIFDFTNLYSARNACQVKVRKGHQLLMTIVGDSLLEPFWPEGTGCGRGFLSSLDAAWLLRQWAMARVNPLEILTERENIYKLLSQTTDGGGNLRDNYKNFTTNPETRYRSIPKKIDHEKILHLYDSDALEELPRRAQIDH